MFRLGGQSNKKGRGVCLSRLIYKILYYIALLNASDTAAAKA